MACLTDLPPEIRLRIYRLLLVDPVRDGLRITMTFDPLDDNKTTWGRARCAQTEQPHNEGHSANPCCIDVPPSTLHHLDFTDLWSLARTSKILYLEATPTIYNNTDTVYSSGIITLDRAPAFTPLNRYFEQHCSTTKAMFQSLVVHDKSATMSVGDMKLVVDAIESHLPNLRAFGYHSSENVANSRSHYMRNVRRRVLRTFKVIQPLTCLKTDIRTVLKLRVPPPPDHAPPNFQVHRPLYAERRAYFVFDIKILRNRVKDRRALYDYHEAALERGDYLEVTLALRSKSAMEKPVSQRTARIEENLARMQKYAVSENNCRRMLCHARRSK